MGHLREYLIVYYLRLKVIDEQIELLQQSGTCHPIGRRKQLHDARDNALLIFNFVQQSAQFEHWCQHRRAGIAILKGRYQLRQYFLAAHIIREIV